MTGEASLNGARPVFSLALLLMTAARTTAPGKDQAGPTGPRKKAQKAERNPARRPYPYGRAGMLYEDMGSHLGFDTAFFFEVREAIEGKWRGGGSIKVTASNKSMTAEPHIVS